MPNEFELPALDFGDPDEEKEALEALIEPGSYQLQFKGYDFDEDRDQPTFRFVVVDSAEPKWNGYQIYHRPYLTDYEDKSKPSKQYKSTILAICAQQISDCAQSGERFVLTPDELRTGSAQHLIDATGTVVSGRVTIREWENEDTGESGKQVRISRFDL